MRTPPPESRNIGPPQGCRLSALQRGRVAVVRPTESLEEIYPMKSRSVPNSTRPAHGSANPCEQSMQFIHDARDAFTHRRMDQVVELGHQLPLTDEGGLRAWGLGFGQGLHAEVGLFGGGRRESCEVGDRWQVQRPSLGGDPAEVG